MTEIKVICPGSQNSECDHVGCYHYGEHKYSEGRCGGDCGITEEITKCLPCFKPSTKKVMLERYVNLEEFRENIGDGVQSFRTSSEQEGRFQHKIEINVFVPQKCPMCGGRGTNEKNN